MDVLPDPAAFELMADQVRSLGGDVPIVVDIGEEMVLRPTEVRELGTLLELLDGLPLWIACRRLSGRRMLRCLLGGNRPLVGRPEEVPPSGPGGCDPAVRLRPGRARRRPARDRRRGLPCRRAPHRWAG